MGCRLGRRCRSGSCSSSSCSCNGGSQNTSNCNNVGICVPTRVYSSNGCVSLIDSCSCCCGCSNNGNGSNNCGCSNNGNGSNNCGCGCNSCSSNTACGCSSGCNSVSSTCGINLPIQPVGIPFWYGGFYNSGCSSCQNSGSSLNSRQGAVKRNGPCKLTSNAT